MRTNKELREAVEKYEKVLDECYKTFDGDQLKTFLSIYDKYFLKKAEKQEGA